MQPTPYLFFNDGKCREAMERYAEVFGGSLTMTMTGAEMPTEFPIEDHMKDWLLHSEVTFPGGKLMGSDSFMEPTPPMAGANVMMSLPTRDEAGRAFERLSVEGEITMPFNKTSWSAGFGMLTDRYGIRWMISCEEAP